MKAAPKKKPVKQRPARRPKGNSGAFVGLSFSIPVDLAVPMNAAAALRGMTRSAYLVWLVRRDLRDVPGLPEPPKAPSRVKRGQ